MHGFQNFFLRQNKLVLEVRVVKNFLKCCHAGQDVDCIKKTHTHCLPSHSCEVGPVCPPASVKPHACFARMLGSLENKKQRLSESTLWKRSFFFGNVIPGQELGMETSSTQVSFGIQQSYTWCILPSLMSSLSWEHYCFFSWLCPTSSFSDGFQL